MQSDRCRHYQLETELILVSGAPVMLRVPMRRCHLAEHMLERLIASEQGADIARKLTFALSPTPVNPSQQDTLAAELKIRAVFGPDLEPIHHEDCIAQRCQNSCTPGYVALLEQFGMVIDPDQAAGMGCQESDELTEDAR